MRFQAAILLAPLLVLAGCTNALLFYETGKLSMTLEGRPDSSQPVQGSLGFKQRTAVVSPPLTKGDDAGDAGGMISSFRVKKEPGLTGPVTIRTALVTGDAANSLNEGEARQAARAVTGAPIDDYAVSARRAWSNLSGAERAEAKGLACTKWEELSDAERQRLGQLTLAGDNYSEPFHQSVALEAECPQEAPR